MGPNQSEYSNQQVILSTEKNTSQERISKIKSFRKNIPSATELTEGILNGNKTALGRAITLVESTNIAHLERANEIIENTLGHTENSIRIGITGVPGVGKMMSY